MTTLYKKTFNRKIGQAVQVTAGVLEGWKKCRLCGETIKAGTPCVTVQPFGEVPAKFHIDCADKIGRSITEAALFFVKSELYKKW